MNRNLDGTPLSDEELFDWAVKGGANPDQLNNQRAIMHGGALFRSLLISASAKARLSAFYKGELNLDTRKEST